jgi:hypothetical protein
MTDSKHTPGRWYVGASGRIIMCRMIAGNNVPVAQITGPLPNDEIKANARLIAAAPDMLEALRGLLETSPPPKGVRLDYSYLLYREAARTAIAKATGRDQMDL